MTVKPSLLEAKTISELRKGGWSDIYVEWFGTVSGMAKALNQSSNPTKAANTMMANPDGVKPGNRSSKSQMFEKFLIRKVNRDMEAAKVPEELDAVLEKFRSRLLHDNSENDWSPEDPYYAPEAKDDD